MFKFICCLCEKEFGETEIEHNHGICDTCRGQVGTIFYDVKVLIQKRWELRAEARKLFLDCKPQAYIDNLNKLIAEIDARIDAIFIERYKEVA